MVQMLAVVYREKHAAEMTMRGAEAQEPGALPMRFSLGTRDEAAMSGRCRQYMKYSKPAAKPATKYRESSEYLI